MFVEKDIQCISSGTVLYFESILRVLSHLLISLPLQRDEKVIRYAPIRRACHYHFSLTASTKQDKLDHREHFESKWKVSLL